jgi:hypothetical protein
MEIYPENEGAASGKPGGFLDISRGHHPRNQAKMVRTPAGVLDSARLSNTPAGVNRLLL